LILKNFNFLKNKHLMDTDTKIPFNDITHVSDDTRIEDVLRELTPTQLAFLATEEPVDGKGFMWTAEEEAAVLQAYDSAASFGVTIRMLKSAAQTKIKIIMDNVLRDLK